MKRLFFLAFGIYAASPMLQAAQTQTAQGRLYCISFNLHQCSTIYGDTLRVNSTTLPDGDDEMIPVQAPGTDIFWPPSDNYVSNLILYDNLTDEGFGGTIYLYPPMADNNGNNHPDFLEVSRGFSNVTGKGYFSAGVWGGSGEIDVTWNRAAGSRTGTISMFLPTWSEYRGLFRGNFEILEYAGPVSYSPATNSVSGSVSLGQTGTAGDSLAGPLQFIKSETNHFNTLVLQPGTMTNGASAAMVFTNHLFMRDAAWPTNYAGYVEFDDDGDLSTLHARAIWVLSINDTNDANHNGIPDFSDDPQPVAPPRRPQVALQKTSTNLLLNISGDVAHTYQVQESLTLGSWQNVTSVVLTNDPQKVALPMPAGVRFWRVSTQ